MKRSFRAALAGRMPWLAIIISLMMIASPSAASAHSTSDGLTVQVNERTVRMRVELPYEAIGLNDFNGDGLIDASEINDQRDRITAELAEEIELTADGEQVPVAIIDLLLSGGEASEDVTIDVASERHSGKTSCSSCATGGGPPYRPAS